MSRLQMPVGRHRQFRGVERAFAERPLLRLVVGDLHSATKLIKTSLKTVAVGRPHHLHRRRMLNMKNLEQRKRKALRF